ncbi:MAG: primase [Bryobacterales bacterium]|nr:primase [Bryobacterales bacterium]
MMDAEQLKAAVDIVAIIGEHLALKRAGATDRYVGLCPFHQEKTPSFTVDRSKGLYHCFGCDVGGDVIKFLMEIEGIAFPEAVARLAQRSGQPERQGKSRNIVATYNYTDESGELLYQVVRTEPKNFLQRYPDGSGGWIWKKNPQQVLYHLREVLENPIIFVVEGERDVETLREHGFTATTNAGGANAPWLPQFTAALAGHEVILIPDRDGPGYARVKRIARALLGKVPRLVYLELEGEGIKDVTDWFNAGHSELEFIAQFDGEEVSQ